MFHLEWRDVAIDDLASGWMQADALRADITAAIHEVERRPIARANRANRAHVF
jgi:hypothetical protein